MAGKACAFGGGGGGADERTTDKPSKVSIKTAGNRVLRSGFERRAMRLHGSHRQEITDRATAGHADFLRAERNLSDPSKVEGGTKAANPSMGSKAFPTSTWWVLSTSTSRGQRCACRSDGLEPPFGRVPNRSLPINRSDRPSSVWLPCSPLCSTHLTAHLCSCRRCSSRALSDLGRESDWGNEGRSAGGGGVGTQKKTGRSVRGLRTRRNACGTARVRRRLGYSSGRMVLYTSS